jgi:hypothetical protein
MIGAHQVTWPIRKPPVWGDGVRGPKRMVQGAGRRAKGDGIGEIQNVKNSLEPYTLCHEPVVGQMDN